MAHPQHQYPPRPYSPPRSMPPLPGAYLPPTKRQRLSPNPPSPYASPSLSNGLLPNQVFSSPHFGAQPNGYQPRAYVDPPQPPPSAGAMGPPSRPVDKPIDVNDLSDVLVGSGVDLKEEEAALFNRFTNPPQQQNTSSFTSDLGATFGLTASTGFQPGNFNPYGQFNTLSQNVPGDRASFYGAGTLNQPVIPIKTAEEKFEEERKRALRRKSERQQYHLNDPFLHGAVIHSRLVKQTHAMHVTLPQEGLLTTNGQRQPVQLAVAGPDRNEVLTIVKGQDLLYSNSPLVEVLTLVSLAAQERIRNVIEDTAALAKGRRMGSHGVVPSELAAIAVGYGTADSALLPTPGNSAVSPKTNPLKRSFSDANKLPTPISDGAATPDTVTFPNQTVQVLRKAINTGHWDEERAAKRSKRAVNGFLSGEASKTGSISMASTGVGVVATIGERAPDVDVRKGSKKDQKRQADAKATEAQQHAATNQTVSMQLGFGKKKPSWMNSGKDATSSSGFSVPSRVNTNLGAQNRATSGTVANGTSGQAHKKTQFGDFQEDKETGRGIQMRDLVLILEPESKEKKALAKAFTKLSSKR